MFIERTGFMAGNNGKAYKEKLEPLLRFAEEWAQMLFIRH